MNTKEAVIVVDYQNTFVPVDEGGTWELWVEGWGEIAAYINTLTSDIRKKWWLIINTRDEHPLWHISLASSYTWKKPITEAFAKWITPDPINTPEYFITHTEIENRNSKSNWFINWDIYDYNSLNAYLKEVSVQALWPDHAMEFDASSKLLSHYNTLESDLEIVKWKSLESDSYSWFWGVLQAEWKSKKSLSDALRYYNINITHIVGLATDFCVWETALDSQKYGFRTNVHTKWIAEVDPSWSAEMLKKLKDNWIQLFH